METRHKRPAGIDSSVSRLLVSTKHLLESLAQWARREVDDRFVSDAYVTLGNDFRAATKAFSGAGVDVSDLTDVPKALRIVLELALTEAPSQQNLDQFLPKIRSIIVGLLQNLKLKQMKAKEIAGRPEGRRSKLLTESMLRQGDRPAENEEASRDRDQASDANSSRKTSEGDIQGSSSQSGSVGLGVERREERAIPGEALTQLQKKNMILRRASKRFSAYQFEKLSNMGSPPMPKEIAEFPEPKEQSSHRELKDVKEPREFRLFLQLRGKTKKVVVDKPPTLASVRLLFVEKFGYSPGGAPFPEIYIQDPSTNVPYELEERNLEAELKSGSLLLLHEESQKPVTHTDLESLQEEFRKYTEALSESLTQRVLEGVTSKLQENAAKSVVAPPIQSAKSDQKAVAALLQELNSLKQAHQSNKAHTRVVTDELSSLTQELKQAALQKNTVSENRLYMEQCRRNLKKKSNTLLAKVDDLQDVMEALRKDVASRGVRVSQQQLASTQKEIEEADHMLELLLKFVKEGKPTWTKIWETELNQMVEEQRYVEFQDELTQDLDEDMKKIRDTFELIEKCSTEQQKVVGKRNYFAPKMFGKNPGESLHSVKDAVMNEVAALVPNHDTRVKAIEKAEKMREKDRSVVNQDPFEMELGLFVEDRKFKNSGGFDEMEKLRQQKDSENLKSSMGII